MSEPVAKVIRLPDGTIGLETIGDAHVYVGQVLYAGQQVTSEHYCPNCYCKCCQLETWSKAE